MSDREKFMKSFPSVDKLYSFFAPVRWEYALRHVDECLTYPCISLADIDDAYHSSGVAQRIVRSQFIGVYSLSTAKEPYNEQSSNLAADMFIGRHGHVCNLFDLMLYFSSYLMEYKQSYAQYDVQDILIQYSRKYLPWKRLKLQQADDSKPETKGTPLPEAVLQWMRDGDTDEDIRAGGLYAQGIITDKMIQTARSQYEAEQAQEVF